MNTENNNLAVMTEEQSVSKAKSMATSLTAMADSFVIDSQEMYDMASQQLLFCSDKIKLVDGERRRLKEPMLEGARRIDDLFRDPLEKFSYCKTVIKNKMSEYAAEKVRQERIEQERIEAEKRAEQERVLAEQRAAEKIQREAREKAEREAREAREEAERIEREAAEAEAEKNRQRQAELDAANAAGDAEAARAAAEAAEKERIAAEAEAQERRRIAEDRQKQIEAEALEAERLASIRANEAQEKLEMATLASTNIAPAMAKSSGSSVRKNWVVRSINNIELIIACGKALEKGDMSLLPYVIIDERVLRGIAKQLKGNARVPGVHFAEEVGVVANSRNRKA